MLHIIGYHPGDITTNLHILLTQHSTMNRIIDDKCQRAPISFFKTKQPYTPVYRSIWIEP